VGSHRVLPLSGPHFWLLPLGFLIASNLADGLTVAPALLLLLSKASSRNGSATGTRCVYALHTGTPPVVDVNS
jgi:hypothetical protein